MNDLIDLAYELGDLIDSMPEFDADSIYYTWEANNGDEVELRFNLKTGKWSSNESFEEFFDLWLGFATMYKNDLEIVKKVTRPEAYELREKMTKIVKENNDN